jgi:superkiller protein 3
LIDDAEMKRRFLAYLGRGTAAIKQGDTATAVRLLEQAAELDSDHVDAALNLGAAYVLEKSFAKAVAVLEPLAIADPENPMVWTNLGAAYLGNPVLARDEDQRRAIEAFERAIELNPMVPNVAYNLGLVHRDRQEYQAALDWFLRAVESDPRDKDAQRNVERMRARLSDQP